MRVVSPWLLTARRGSDARNAVPGGHDVAVHGRIATGNSPVHWWPQ